MQRRPKYSLLYLLVIFRSQTYPKSIGLLNIGDILAYLLSKARWFRSDTLIRLGGIPRQC